MSVVEIERGDGIMVIRMNRPERLTALGTELRAGLKQAWEEFDASSEHEIAILREHRFDPAGLDGIELE